MPKSPSWNESPCPKCSEPVAISASRCPNCTHEFTEAEIATRKSDRKNAFIGCALLLVILILTVSFCSGADSEEATEPPPAGSASPQVVKAFGTWHGDMIGAMSKCDAAGGRFAQLADRMAAGEVDQYEAYNEVTFVVNACEQSYLQLGDVSIPDTFDGSTGTKAENAIEECRTTMIAKKMGAQTFQSILDGDQKPSTIQKLNEDAEFVGQAAMQCGAGLLHTAHQAGVDYGKFIEQAP